MIVEIIKKDNTKNDMESNILSLKCEKDLLECLCYWKFLRVNTPLELTQKRITDICNAVNFGVCKVNSDGIASANILTNCLYQLIADPEFLSNNTYYLKMCS